MDFVKWILQVIAFSVQLAYSEMPKTGKTYPPYNPPEDI